MQLRFDLGRFDRQIEPQRDPFRYRNDRPLVVRSAGSVFLPLPSCPDAPERGAGSSGRTRTARSAPPRSHTRCLPSSARRYSTTCASIICSSRATQCRAKPADRRGQFGQRLHGPCSSAPAAPNPVRSSATFASIRSGCCERSAKLIPSRSGRTRDPGVFPSARRLCGGAQPVDVGLGSSPAGRRGHSAGRGEPARAATKLRRPRRESVLLTLIGKNRPSGSAARSAFRHIGGQRNHRESKRAFRPLALPEPAQGLEDASPTPAVPKASRIRVELSLQRAYVDRHVTGSVSTMASVAEQRHQVSHATNWTADLSSTTPTRADARCCSDSVPTRNPIKASGRLHDAASA